MKKITVLTTNEKISTLKYGYDDIKIEISSKKPSIYDIIFRKNYFLIRKDFKKELGLSLILINLFRKRWSINNEYKRLFFNKKEMSPYKFIMPNPESNSLYGSQLNFKKLHTIKFHTIRKISSNNFNISLFIFYLISLLGIFTNKNIKSIICINTINIMFLKTIKNFFPNSKIYIRYHDMIDSGYLCFKNDNFLNELNKLKQFALSSNIYIETYSQTDSEKYNLKYIPNSINSLSLNKISHFYEKKHIENSVFFLGTANEKRLHILVKIATILNKLNLKFEFYLILKDIKNNYLINRILSFNNSNEKMSVQVIQHVSYNEYIQLLISHNTIIDLYQISKDEGYSFRIPEAILLNKKIITNREIIKNESFYNPKNILVFKENSSEEVELDKSYLKTFLNNYKAEYSQQIKDLFSFHKYLEKHNIFM